MKPRRDSVGEADEVQQLLAPLAHARTEIPSADAVYWRAQARLAIEELNRQRRGVLRPLRLFHLTIGAAAIALGALASVWPLLMPASPGAELLTVPFIVVTVAVGAYFLAETGTAS